MPGHLSLREDIMAEQHKSQLTYAQLMAANPEDLAVEDLLRRTNLTALKKAERELELVESQNQVFQDKKTDAKRIADTKTTILIEEENRINRERSICKHKTGGKGLPGFYNGDGKQGYSVATQILPTGEVYFLCFRCQKEWHMPKKRDVLDRKITLDQYDRQVQAYNEVAAWDKPLFETDSGEIPGSVRFMIPKLEDQRVRDDADFEEFLKNKRVQVA